MEEKSRFIEKIAIKNLWNKYDIAWNLNPDVNILIGENGTGKSTVLGLLHTLYQGSYHKQYLFDKFEVSLNTEESNNIFPEQSYDFPTPQNEITFISTFDFFLKDEKEISSKNEQIRTELDYEIQGLITEFKSYLLKLAKRKDEVYQKLMNQSFETEDDDVKKLGQVMSQLKQVEQEIDKYENIFTQIINQTFSNTNKVIDFDENNSIIFKQGKTFISPYELSSGEKQMLIIFLSLVIQEDKYFTLVLDEPEISLHLRWQSDLIDNIRKLNPNCQIILATHAPAIAKKGWKNHIFQIEDLKQEIASKEDTLIDETPI